MKKITFSLGHLLLFAVVAGLMAVNGALLYAMQHKVADEKKTAQEAAKPAELELTLLSAPGCAECYDLEGLVAPLRNNPQVRIRKEETFEYTSAEGAALIAKYGIVRVPTVIVQGQTDKAFDAASFVQNVGKKADDGALVVTSVPPPYVEVASGAVKGKFTVTYLTDKGCKNCYDPTLHRAALANLAMKATEEKFVDRTDTAGRALIAKYSIASTPTIVLAGDLGEYPRFLQVWPTVGTTEKDGAYVFRAGQQYMGAYHDLKTGKVISPPPPESASAATPPPAAPVPQPNQ